MFSDLSNQASALILILYRLSYNSDAAAFLGRLTNSPPQFGQTAFIPSVHSPQNVHS
jgi:hypothetical protein